MLSHAEFKAELEERFAILYEENEKAWKVFKDAERQQIEAGQQLHATAVLLFGSVQADEAIRNYKRK